MKKPILLLIGLFLLLLTACAPSEKDSEKGEAKIVDNLKIAFTSAKKLNSDDGDIIQLNFTVENITADTRGFDSSVFLAENVESESLKIAPKENFSTDLEPGEEIAGSIYYYLEGTTPITMTYDDSDSQEKESWIVVMEE